MGRMQLPARRGRDIMGKGAKTIRFLLLFSGADEARTRDLRRDRPAF